MIQRLKSLAPLIVVLAVVVLSACTVVASTATTAPDSALSLEGFTPAALQQTLA